MNIIIKAIKFNHDPNSASHDALNIRKNKSQFIDIPEWVHGTTTKAEDSLSAYAIKETQGNTITIQARFKANDIGKAEIRAIAIEPFPSPFENVGFGGWLGWLMNIILWILGMTFGNVLGEVKAKWVTFSTGGDSGYVTFELENPKIGDSGVGIHFTTWKWLYRLESGGPWIDIDTTRHKIYVLLDIPKDPWKQSPHVATNDQLPWTEVLDYSCKWANGQLTEDGATGAITKEVNDGIGLTYDMNNGATKYTHGGAFNCTWFIKYLKTGENLGKTVNCTDCGTIVTTFSNSVGCDLHASRMGLYFGLNKIIAIGQSGWGCPNWGCKFSYHEVAWKGGGNDNDPLFDACLKIDGDDNPWAAPHTELLPVNIKFTTLPGATLPLPTPFTANSYRERLCQNNAEGIEKCIAIGPWPNTNNGRRRVI
ncbi:MAG: hypothetical protein HXS46_09445 [Theionarchaea archaeon]|nr:MAG: hypothetical protein AYK18_15965 [Theionarchaea archaeon DG-70]MBU7010903.1 hypothetical protein [Theionarchaea archaeon]